MMKRMSVLMVFLVMILLVSTGGSFAQSGGSPGPELVVPLDGAEVFRVGSSISRVVTGQSDVVNVRVVNNREIVLFGLSQGATTLHVWTDAGLVQRLLVVEQVSSQTVGNNFRSVLRDEEDLEDDVELRVFSPQHRGVSEFEEYIGELLADDGEILLSDGPSRKIFVAGKPQLLDKISQLVDRLDVPGEDKVYSKRFVLENRPVTQIDTQVEAMLSEEGQIVSDRETNSLLIVDEVSKVNSIQNYLREIDVPTVAQVRITTRFVEMSDEASRQLGVDWDFEGGGVEGSLNPQIADDADGLLLDLVTPAGASTADIDARLNALEEKDLLNLISSPNVVTRNQQQAQLTIQNQESYVAGCEVQSVEGAQTLVPTLETLEDGITLEVTPLIGKNKTIQLDVTPELKISELGEEVSFSGSGAGSGCTFFTPETDVRRAQLNVAIRDGGTLVIGGLKREETTRDNSGVPLLQDIPILGYAFSQRGRSSTNRDITIFVTAEIVNLQSPENAPDTTPPATGFSESETIEGPEEKQNVENDLF